MPDNFIDLTVTSPPYDNLRTYNGYSFDFEPIARELYRVTKDGGVVVWIVGDATIKGSETGTSFRQALYLKDIGFNLHDTMIYGKDSFQKPSHNRYWSCFEYMFIFSKGKPTTYNLISDRPNSQKGKTVKSKTVRNLDGSTSSRNPVQISDYGKRTNIWFYSTGYMKGAKDKIAYSHPAIFPEQLANDHIISWSNERELVYDPFTGSGTTAKMAILNNRHFIGSEVSKEYCEIALKRIALGKTKLPKI
jgi:site-specific DNA-methyltransferase (adenine-specific)